MLRYIFPNNGLFNTAGFSMKNRKKKRHIYAAAKAYHDLRGWLSDEEYCWEFIQPVGREFGSPDYERLTKLDRAAERAGL